MEEIQKATGKCHFCDQQFSKAGINKHLKKHLEEEVSSRKPGSSFLIKVEPHPKFWIEYPYFLSIWVDGKAHVEDVDYFLRGVWLECCGHLSSFQNPSLKKKKGGMMGFLEAEELLESGKVKEYEKMMEEMDGEIPMSRKASDVFFKGLKLDYEYDFGSSTNLQVTVMGEFPCRADEKIVLLSRNEPLAIMCHTCKTNLATEICSVCDYEDTDNIFCPKCAKKHGKQCEDFADYSALPVVNSPRMGVCAYEGGALDTARDKALPN